MFASSQQLQRSAHLYQGLLGTTEAKVKLPSAIGKRVRVRRYVFAVLEPFGGVSKTVVGPLVVTHGGVTHPQVVEQGWSLPSAFGPTHGKRTREVIERSLEITLASKQDASTR